MSTTETRRYKVRGKPEHTEMAEATEGKAISRRGAEIAENARLAVADD
jgi:hypothetical protein